MAASVGKCARIKLFFKHYTIEPSWLLIKTKQFPLVEDIEKHILTKFNLPFSGIKLLSDGCILPSWESTELLQDNDAVDVVIKKNMDTYSHTIEEPQHKKKKHKINKDGNARKDPGVDESLSKRNSIAEVTNKMDCSDPSEKGSAESTCVKKRKRKHKKENGNIEQKATDSCSENIEKSENNISQKKRKKKQSDIDEVVGSVIQDLNHMGSSKVLETVPKSINNGVKNVTSLLPEATTKDAFDNVSHSQNSSLNVSNCVNNVPLGDSEIKKKRTRVRKRKRKTSPSQVNSPSLTVSEKPAEMDCSASKDIKLNLPRSKQPNNKRITFNDSSESQEEEEEVNVSSKPEYISPSKDISKNPSARQNIDTGITENECSYGNSVVKVRTPKILNNVESVQNLTNSAKVYTRQKPCYMNTEEHLVTVPVVSKETPKVNCTEMDTSVYNENENGSFTNKEETVVIPKDYSKFPALHGPPRIGDKIAFKVLELSETYEPGLSDFKEAEVLNYDPASTTVTLKILNQPATPKVPGKFDIIDEDCEDVWQDEVMHEWTSLVEPKLL